MPSVPKARPFLPAASRSLPLPLPGLKPNGGRQSTPSISKVSSGCSGMLAMLARLARRFRFGQRFPPMDLLEAAGLALAAFLAGAINAVAGGGSLISFPALIAAGYPSKAANVTNSVALWPGYLGGSYGYRGELKRQRGRIIALTIPSVVGAIAGS